MYSIGLGNLILRGAQAVQRLIDSGAFITWTEANGLEMVAEFQREVGRTNIQTNKFITAKALLYFALLYFVLLYLMNLSHS